MFAKSEYTFAEQPKSELKEVKYERLDKKGIPGFNRITE
jgi:hypothetical protein